MFRITTKFRVFQLSILIPCLQLSNNHSIACVRNRGEWWGISDVGRTRLSLQWVANRNEKRTTIPSCVPYLLTNNSIHRNLRPQKIEYIYIYISFSVSPPLTTCKYCSHMYNLDCCLCTFNLSENKERLNNII